MPCYLLEQVTGKGWGRRAPEETHAPSSQAEAEPESALKQKRLATINKNEDKMIELGLGLVFGELD